MDTGDSVSHWAVPRDGRWQVMRGEHLEGIYWETTLGQPVDEDTALRILRARESR